MPENKLPRIFLTIFVFVFTLLIINHLLQPHFVLAGRKAKNEVLKSVLKATNYLPVIPETLWKAYDNSKDFRGIVFKTFPKGYCGIIPLAVGVDVRGKITGIFVGGKEEGFNETEGIGSRVRDTCFTNQFIGKSLAQVNLKEDGGEIDAITGATISSKAVIDGIRKALQGYVGYLDAKFEVFPHADAFHSVIEDTLWTALLNSETIGIVVFNFVIMENDTIKFIAGLDNKNNITGIKIIAPEKIAITDTIKGEIKKKLKIYKTSVK